MMVLFDLIPYISQDYDLSNQLKYSNKVTLDSALIESNALGFAVLRESI